MDNNDNSTQSTKDATVQPSGSDDELSYPTSPRSKPLVKSSSDTASIDKSRVNRKQATPAPEQTPTKEAKPKRTVRFADELESLGTPRPENPESATSPASGQSLQPPMAGQKRSRTVYDKVGADMPRKRGRPPKKRGPGRKRGSPLSPSIGPTKVSSGGSAAAQADAGKRPPAGADPEPVPGPAHVGEEMMSLVREVFVVNSLDQDGGLSVPWALAVRMHAVFAPGLPEPRGGVYVKADLAAKIRALFNGIGE